MADTKNAKLNAKLRKKHQRLLRVVERFHAQLIALDAKDDADGIEGWSIEFGDFLDQMAAQDAFGTEGQSDPRGDMRNGEWTMDRVEGIDK